MSLRYDIDLSSEDRIDLKTLAKEEGVHFSTVFRWALKGRYGIPLPNLLIGGKRVTTREAFQWWCEAVTAAANGGAVASRTNRQREAAIRKAEAEFASL